MMNNGQKLRVVVLAGARSTEHEVSLVSAYNIVNAINRDKYEVGVVGISKDGEWRLYDPEAFAINPESVGTVRLSDKPISGRLAVTQNSHKFYDIDNSGTVVAEADIIFPAVLGNYAEDGTMQGLLRMMDVPFTTPDVLGSSVGMDKDVAHRLMQNAGISVADSVTVRKHEERPDFETIKAKLGSDVLFVKPSNAGSSVGVTRVTNQDNYLAALNHAFTYDVKVLIQKGVIGREVEVAVIGNIGDQHASVIGEIITKNKDDFYSYSNKYINVNDTTVLSAPAEIPDDIAEQIKKQAIRVCEVLECEGFSRVDFFIDNDGKIYVNEVNTMPGFTATSMFPRLWGLSGLDYPSLVDKLLDYAFERYNYRVAPLILDSKDVLDAAVKLKKQTN